MTKESSTEEEKSMNNLLEESEDNLLEDNLSEDNSLEDYLLEDNLSKESQDNSSEDNSLEDNLSDDNLLEDNLSKESQDNSLEDYLLEDNLSKESQDNLLEDNSSEDNSLEDNLSKESQDNLLENPHDNSQEMSMNEPPKGDEHETTVATTEFEEVEDICDQCLGEANVFCKECNNSYCTSCSLQRHRIGKRKEHLIARLSKIITKVVHVPLDDDGLSQPTGISY